RGQSRARQGRRDRLPLCPSGHRRPRPLHPPHGRGSGARAGDGARGTEARRGGVFHDGEDRPHRGALPPPPRGQALRLMAAKPSYRLLLRIWPYLRLYLHWLVIGSALALVVSSAEGFIAWLVKPALDALFPQRALVTLKITH